MFVDVCFDFWDQQYSNTHNIAIDIEGLQLKPLPNNHTIQHLLLITPVKSATVECSNSSPHYAKNVYHNTMKEESLTILLPEAITK